MQVCREAKCGKVPPWLETAAPSVTYQEVQTKFDRKRDFLGFIDVLVMCPPVMIGIQATTGDHVAARVRKICYERSQNAWYWLSCGGAIQVWGWRKYKTPQDGKWWRPRIVDIHLKDLRFV